MSQNESSVPRTRLLVIGYGNTLRGDDGVGPRVAEAVEALKLPGVRTFICQQLSPEHAEMISRAERVVFVDAAVDAPKEVQLRELAPGDTTQLMAHAADPRTMLALAREVFGHAPKAWWLTIPAVSLEFSEAFTPEAKAGLVNAVQRIKTVVGEPRDLRPTLKRMNDAAKQHKWVQDYNWDDGLSAIWPIVESDETEFATALLIYWRLDGPWFARRHQALAEDARLHALVERRLRDARYPIGSCRYYPVVDNQLSQVQVAKLKQEGFPIQLIEPAYNDQLASG